MNRAYLIGAFVSLIIGLLIFFFTAGPVRFYGGDVVAVIFLYSIISLVVKAHPLQKASLVFTVALIIEIEQFLTELPNTLVGELFLGSSFDVYDLVAYVAGLVIAVSVDKPFKRTTV